MFTNRVLRSLYRDCLRQVKIVAVLMFLLTAITLSSCSNSNSTKPPITPTEDLMKEHGL